MGSCCVRMVSSQLIPRWMYPPLPPLSMATAVRRNIHTSKDVTCNRIYNRIKVWLCQGRGLEDHIPGEGHTSFALFSLLIIHSPWQGSRKALHRWVFSCILTLYPWSKGRVLPRLGRSTLWVHQAESRRERPRSQQEQDTMTWIDRIFRCFTRSISL